MADDLFDAIFNLEDKSYEQGYHLGVADGSRAGRIEGRAFGLEKGFAKFLSAGKLHGRACVWGARSAASDKKEKESSEPTRPDDDRTAAAAAAATPWGVQMAPLPANERLERHIRTLYALVEPETLATQNSEDAVSDFDDRVKRALAKVKVIENILGEQGGGDALPGRKPAQAGPGVRLSSSKTTTTTTGDKNIEDFGIRPTRS
jgi:hypothetical protein